MAATRLIDTNILVYRFDARFPDKQAIATRLLGEGLKTDSVRIPHDAVLEFMAAVTQVKIGSNPLLRAAEARRETEQLLDQFRILYPDEVVVRTALRGTAAYTSCPGLMPTSGLTPSAMVLRSLSRRTSSTEGCTAVCERTTLSCRQPAPNPASVHLPVATPAAMRKHPAASSASPASPSSNAPHSVRHDCGSSHLWYYEVRNRSTT